MLNSYPHPKRLLRNTGFTSVEKKLWGFELKHAKLQQVSLFKNTDEYKHMFSMTAITMELSITISFFLLCLAKGINLVTINWGLNKHIRYKKRKLSNCECQMHIKIFILLNSVLFHLKLTGLLGLLIFSTLIAAWQNKLSIYFNC